MQEVQYNGRERHIQELIRRLRTANYGLNQSLADYINTDRRQKDSDPFPCLLLTTQGTGTLTP